MEISIELPTDMDGFVDYECPFCERRFRLKTNAFQNDDIQLLYCPYCGMSAEPNKFGTEELAKLIEENATRLAQEEIEKQLKKLARNSKGFIKYKPGKKVTPQKVILDESINCKILCNKCDSEYKVGDGNSVIHYCPYCGEMNE